VIAAVEGTFVAFHRRLRDMQAAMDDELQPEHADVRGLRQMMSAMVLAGEGAMREVFEEKARAARPA
jgi:hypothetical protein